MADQTMSQEMFFFSSSSLVQFYAYECICRMECIRPYQHLRQLEHHGYFGIQIRMIMSITRCVHHPFDIIQQKSPPCNKFRKHHSTQLLFSHWNSICKHQKLFRSYLAYNIQSHFIVSLSFQKR